MTNVQVAFPGPDGMTLQGWLSIPAGRGPFPVMIYNHSSDPEPGFQPDLADFYTSKGFIFFIPNRHGQGLSLVGPGGEAYTYIVDAEAECERKNRTLKALRICKVKLHEKYNEDVVAAVEWIKGPEPLGTYSAHVETHRIVMSGLSYGAVQTLLAAEKGLGLKACVAFSPASQSWGNKQLEKRMTDAVKIAPVPIFLIQANNDYNIQPTFTLGPVLMTKESLTTLNRYRLYSAFGATQTDSDGKITETEGHGLFALGAGGIAVWGPDVLDFLNEAIR